MSIRNITLIARGPFLLDIIYDTRTLDYVTHTVLSFQILLSASIRSFLHNPHHVALVNNTTLYPILEWEIPTLIDPPTIL